MCVPVFVGSLHGPRSLARRASAGLAVLLLPLAPGCGDDAALALLRREALRLCMVVRVNGFELGGTGSGGAALFPRVAALNHDCSPNCGARWDAAEGRLAVRTLRRVAAGEELTISYLGLGFDGRLASAADDADADEDGGAEDGTETAHLNDDLEQRLREDLRRKLRTDGVGGGVERRLHAQRHGGVEQQTMLLQ